MALGWFQERQLPILIGFVDGMLTALTLAAGKLLEVESTITFSLALRVALASLVSSGFVFFVAKYSELRGQLIHAEKQLNLTSSGKLASTRLGRKVLNQSSSDALISGLSGFLGAFLPLISAILVPEYPWFAIAFSSFILAILGFILGNAVGRKPIIWSLMLALGGLVVSLIGYLLHIV